MEYNGSLEDLQQTVTNCGYEISEVKEVPNGYQIRTTDGALLNWFRSTGKVNVQGKANVRQRLEAAWNDHHGVRPSVAEPVPALTAQRLAENGNKKVFVVHGHDSTSREQLELVLHKLQLEPYVLQNTGGSGLTIIEALEGEIGNGSDRARFGIVLMTPDDMGYAQIDGEASVQPRARQNVVLEMGMLISSLSRSNVVILKKGHIELPSDANGIIYLGFNEHVKEVVPRLADRLKVAGFVLNTQAVTSASS